MEASTLMSAPTQLCDN